MVVDPIIIAARGARSSFRSHEELDVAEGGVAIGQVDPLDLELAVFDAQVMRQKRSSRSAPRSALPCTTTSSSAGTVTQV